MTAKKAAKPAASKVERTVLAHPEQFRMDVLKMVLSLPQYQTSHEAALAAARELTKFILGANATKTSNEL